MSLPRCKPGRVPLVRLGFARQACLRASGPRLNTSADIARFAGSQWADAPQEHFAVLFLSASNELLGVQEVSVGGLASTEVDPRVVFSAALLSGCTAVVLVHNHPSGNREPSTADEALTRNLVAGSRLLGIRVLDHVIVARGGGYTSLAERGLL